MVDVQGPFCRINWYPVNLNSHSQIKDYLITQGWVPTEWNMKLEGREWVKSSPKLTEDSFDSVKGEVPQLVTRRAVLVHRQRLIKNTRKDGEESGLLNLMRPDGRIEARAIPNATNTGRYRHSGVVNIPNPYAAYGSDIRSLFTAPDNYCLVGVDAAALEARIQAHYVYPFKGGPELADILLNGDIHTKNQELWDMAERNDAKSPYYALMYGAQPQKLSETMKCSVWEATKRYEDFWEEYVALDMFKTQITKAWEARGGKSGGFLKGLDGRKLYARSPHALVNLMFQSGGSIVVKLATVLTDKLCEQRGLRSVQVLHMHDEFQRETHKEDAEEVAELAQLAFKRAGEYFKMNVPIVGEAKIGKNWGETH